MVSFSAASFFVLRRNGDVTNFNADKIKIAIQKAFIAHEGTNAINYAHVIIAVDKLTQQVLIRLQQQYPSNATIHIENIQDIVEQTLMSNGHHAILRLYILYREQRNAQRLDNKQKIIKVQYFNELKDLDVQNLENILLESSKGLENIDINLILKETLRNLYDGVPFVKVLDCVILSSRALIEKNPDYSLLAARILLHVLKHEVLGQDSSNINFDFYNLNFKDFINKGIENKLLNPLLLNFDLNKIANAINPTQDLNLNYLGLQTLYDRYFLHVQEQRIEMPQWFFMRVAMGLALNENNKEDKAIEFYKLLSSFDFMSSTPTLFNSATLRSQLSSCYLTTISDDLEGIYDGLKENALLSKFAGGLGNDWTNIRALGSRIKGTNGKSQGVIPFLKVANDTLVAVNQGGKRLGSGCAYLETWHLDIEGFLELRKNTGDDRRRTHDMNTANWIPDLFMKRVIHKQEWTLFSPADVTELHDLYGKDFENKYTEYEHKTENGEIKLFKKIQAIDLWRKMLSMLFETGHPWITFKDPCNIRSPQQHVGVVHSSNLCTEITLNTNDEEIAVCNLGSVNLVNHLKQNLDGTWILDTEKLQKTISIAIRMLDNVIDINFYPVKKAENSNLKHRPIGMGMMGFQDCLQKMKIPYASQQAIEFADISTETICYYAYLASSKLAIERGTYSTYQGSLWSKGIMPQDTIEMVSNQRGKEFVELDMSSTLDWQFLRQHIKQYGMRNSNCIAIAPTATISNIIGVSASIEPSYQNLYVKSNLSGEFTIINQYLVKQLQDINLWDDVMIADLKYFDGSMSNISRIPNSIKQIYATAFEIDANWLIECASRRQKWIDQAQSLNIYVRGVSGKKLDEIYKLAWLRCLKTTYYLRTMGATHAEKSTINTSNLNAVAITADLDTNSAEPAACYLRPGDEGFEDCESCQ